MKKLATLCPKSEISCHVDQTCCPEIFHNDRATTAKRVSINDDFGNRVFMSENQLRDLIEKARSGELKI